MDVSLNQPCRVQDEGPLGCKLLSFGDNNDGMFLFEHKGKMILAVNNEYANNDKIGRAHV